MQMRLQLFAFAVAAAALFHIRTTQAEEQEQFPHVRYHYKVLTKRIKDPMLIVGIKVGEAVVHEQKFSDKDWNEARGLFTHSIVQGMGLLDFHRKDWPGALCVIDGSVDFEPNDSCRSDKVALEFFPVGHDMASDV